MPDAAPAFGALDTVTTAGQAVTVSGWAADPDTDAPVHVHVYVDGMLTTTTADQLRLDVAAVFPALGSQRGFRLTVPAAPGDRRVCVYAINNNLTGPHTLLGCRTVTVPAPHAAAPFGVLDAVQWSGGTVTVTGWAHDPDTGAPILVHVYLDGAAAPTTIVAGEPRPDVALALPGAGPAHGFSGTFAAARRVCVYAINDNLVGPHTLLGCRSIA
jgi:hypothetical protein